MYIGRFAPSPTGRLHLGHAFSALLAWERARKAGGECLLRIEDLDATRSREAYEAGIFEDLAWLGLSWPDPVLRQSDRWGAYDAALDRLWHDLSLLFVCTCTRKDILALAAPQEGAIGPDGPVYPGTCRIGGHSAWAAERPERALLRLDMEAALDEIDGPLGFHETGAGPGGETGWIAINRDEVLTGIGDVALARRDIGVAYHLAVVVDDAFQNVTEVCRGEDLFEATKIHVMLQRLLGLPTPTYHHHRLIRDEAGRRLAKRDDARALQTFRQDGLSPAKIRERLGFGAVSSLG